MGVLSSAAIAETLWKWGGTFTVAGFLLNGGLEGFKCLAGKGLEQISYEVDWKNIPISIFAIQRTWLYALPAGLILLISWRKRLLKNEKGLPLWIEWCLYTTMPLFHIHTFIFLSALLFIWALTGPNRKETIKLAALAASGLVSAGRFRDIALQRVERYFKDTPPAAPISIGRYFVRTI